jgi:hypothetical protein
MENYFAESEETIFFSAPSLLVYSRGSLHGIHKELLLSQKLFDRALARFSRESTLESVPNRA